MTYDEKESLINMVVSYHRMVSPEDQVKAILPHHSDEDRLKLLPDFGTRDFQADWIKLPQPWRKHYVELAEIYSQKLCGLIDEIMSK